MYATFHGQQKSQSSGNRSLHRVPNALKHHRHSVHSHVRIIEVGQQQPDVVLAVHTAVAGVYDSDSGIKHVVARPFKAQQVRAYVHESLRHLRALNSQQSYTLVGTHSSIAKSHPHVQYCIFSPGYMYGLIDAAACGVRTGSKHALSCKIKKGVSHLQ